MDVICGIYKIENVSNKKVYIGESVNIYSRWRDHKSSLKSGKHYNTHLQNAWNKYGESNFVFSIVEKCEKDKLNEMEMYYIDLFDSLKNGYNLTAGGEGMNCYVYTQELREKRSKQLSGKNNPMFGRCAELSPVFGTKKTKEQIQAMIDSRWTNQKRVEQSIKVSGINNPMYGRIGSKNPESKAVVCLNNGKIFESTKSAANWCGLKSQQMIGQVCLGKRKHAGIHPETGEKLRWKYTKDYIINQCGNNEVAL